MKSVGSLAIVLLVALSTPSIVSATIISTSVSGPGGTGTASASPFLLWSVPKLTFTSIDYIDVSITVDTAGTYRFVQQPFNIFGHIYGADTLNQTGVDWRGFQIVNLTPDNSFISSVNPSDALSTIVFDSNSASFTGTPIVQNGGGIDINLEITTNGPGTFVIREIPIAVPEASTLQLIGATIFVGGVIYLTRRRGITRCVEES